MKSIIKGKLYNTDTATEVGSWSNGYYGNDFRSASESLYRKKTGEFFLFGSGGPMTRWSHPVGDMTSGGSKIIPMTYDEAREWAEEHLDADEYIALFEPIPDEDAGELVQMKFYLTAGTATELRRRASMEGVQPSALAERLLSDALK